MATLASATLDAARELPGWTVVEGVATGGSTTTLIDTGFPWLIDGTNAPADDYYNGGTLWFLTGTNAGKCSMITDWAKGTKTFTFATTGAVVATVQYAAAAKDYPLFILRQNVNKALERIGNVDQRNSTLTTVSDQIAYTLPAGVANVKRVEIARASAAPYYWIVSHHWREIGGAIEFDDGMQPGSTGMLIRLTYSAPLARLDDDADTIPDLIHPQLVKWLTVAEVLRWKVTRIDSSEKAKVQAFSEALARAEVEAARYMRDIEQTPREHQFSKWAAIDLGPDQDSEPDHARY